MRGKSIFHNSHYKDVGAFQFYGTGVDNLVVGMTMERGGGFQCWGQYRNCHGRASSQPCDPTTPGVFVNPNLMNQFIDNEVLEGLRAEHQGEPLGLGGWGDVTQNNGHVFAIHTGEAGAPKPELNRFIVFRGNKAHSNGGFFIATSSDVLLERNTVNCTPSQSISGQRHYHVEPGNVATLLVGNK